MNEKIFVMFFTRFNVQCLVEAFGVEKHNP